MPVGVLTIKGGNYGNTGQHGVPEYRRLHGELRKKNKGELRVSYFRSSPNFCGFLRGVSGTPALRADPYFP